MKYKNALEILKETSPFTTVLIHRSWLYVKDENATNWSYDKCIAKDIGGSEIIYDYPDTDLSSHSFDDFTPELLKYYIGSKIPFDTKWIVVIGNQELFRYEDYTAKIDEFRKYMDWNVQERNRY